METQVSFQSILREMQVNIQEFKEITHAVAKPRRQLVTQAVHKTKVKEIIEVFHSKVTDWSKFNKKKMVNRDQLLRRKANYKA